MFAPNLKMRSVGTDKLEIFGDCLFSKKPYAVTITLQQFKAWQNGKMIQQAMPDVKPQDREFILSGICPSAYDAMFSEEC